MVLTLCLGKLFCPSHLIFWVAKMVWKMSSMVWFCEFWGGINDWDLKILYWDLESWKKIEKKINKMEWFVRLEIWIILNSMKWNGERLFGRGCQICGKLLVSSINYYILCRKVANTVG